MLLAPPLWTRSQCECWRLPPWRSFWMAPRSDLAASYLGSPRQQRQHGRGVVTQAQVKCPRVWATHMAYECCRQRRRTKKCGERFQSCTHGYDGSLSGVEVPKVTNARRRVERVDMLDYGPGRERTPPYFHHSRVPSIRVAYYNRTQSSLTRKVKIQRSYTTALAAGAAVRCTIRSYTRAFWLNQFIYYNNIASD